MTVTEAKPKENDVMEPEKVEETKPNATAEGKTRRF